MKSKAGALSSYLEFLESVNNALFKEAVRNCSVVSHKINGANVQVTRCKSEWNTWNFSQSKQDHTIYVSNLPSTIDKPQLRLKFDGFGSIKDIRLTIRDKIAFAYVEYESATSANNSLVINGESFGHEGKICQVAISDVRKKKIVVIDTKRLIVTNLPFRCTKQDLETMFGSVCF